MAIVLAAEGRGAAVPSRDASDSKELARLRGSFPRVVERIEDGEALQTAGDVARALSIFDQAAAEYAHSELLQRRRCEALTALGRRYEAIVACRDAIVERATPSSIRAGVRAYLSGPGLPPARDLAQALMMGAVQRRQHPDQLWGYAALCDVAERIGDRVMLEYCSSELLRIAPEDPETLRLVAVLQPRGWVLSGWVAIALLGLATAGHALWQWMNGARQRSRRTTAVALLWLTACGIHAVPARADDNKQQAPMGAAPSAATRLPSKNPGDISDWKINQEFPDSEIPGEGARNRNPLQFGYWLQDVTARALKASKAGDHETAIKFFKALAKAVPDRAIAFGKLCTEYAAIGQRDNAIVACSGALLREGVLLGDYAQYVHVVLDKSGPLNDKEIAALTDVVKHVRDDPNGGDPAAVEIECDIGVKMRDASRLQQCTSAMSAHAPNAAKTLTYEWSLAMVQGRYEEAERLIQRAKEGSMRPDGLAQMDRETARERSRHRMALVFGGASALLVLAALALAVAAFRRRSAVSSPITQET